MEIVPISIARKLEAKKNDKRRKMDEVTLKLITRSKYITKERHALFCEPIIVISSAPALWSGRVNLVNLEAV